MTRLFVLGTGPLIGEGVTFFSGQCLRTWHFTQPLRSAGHDVTLITLPIDDREYREGDPVLTEATFEGLRHRVAHTNRPDLLMPALQRALDESNAEAILGINPGPAAVACRLDSDLPLWADMNGYTPAEGQTRGQVHGDDSALAHFWQTEWDVVRRADFISTVTRRQAEATLGELAMAGRLNRHTFNHPFTHFIPNAVASHFANLQAPPPQFRGKTIPEDAQIILWSGGFNTWTDIDLLHAALDDVMDLEPKAHFVATGGAIAGHDEMTFERFKRLSAKCKHADRRHVLGWVEGHVVDALFHEADLGINIDAPNWETHFGARNRLTNMMACGLPVLTTRGTEISEDLAAADVAITVPMEDPDALAEGLCKALSEPQALQEQGRRGREFVLREYSYASTTRPCAAWAARPTRAPDAGRRSEADNPLDWRLDLLHPERVEALTAAERDLRAIRSKWFWRLGQSAKRLLGGG